MFSESQKARSNVAGRLGQHRRPPKVSWFPDADRFADHCCTLFHNFDWTKKRQPVTEQVRTLVSWPMMSKNFCDHNSCIMQAHAWREIHELTAEKFSIYEFTVIKFEIPPSHQQWISRNHAQIESFSRFYEPENVRSRNHAFLPTPPPKYLPSAQTGQMLWWVGAISGSVFDAFIVKWIRPILMSTSRCNRVLSFE